MRTFAGLTLVLLLGGCVSSPAPEVVRYPSAPLNGQALPFSEAVRVGDLLFAAGQIGNQPGTRNLAPGGIAGEARQTLENMQAVLERHGSSLDHVVKVTVFLADIKDWPAFNEVYVQYFKGPLPARSALGANGLALGAKVEVECIAVVPPPAK
ncbi:MAG: Rid family detoxifying hydrolase [Lacunisphaera sp.]|nr:Rid family detoxifying hydrolase [Lacunisphaera sp.]